MRRVLTVLVATVVVATGCQSATSPSTSIPSATALPGVTVQKLDRGPIGLATDGRKTWVVLNERDALTDLAGGEPIPVGGNPLRATITDAGVWVTLFSRASIVLVDPARGRVVRTVSTGNGSKPEGIAHRNGNLWVVDQINDDVLRIDERSGRITATIAVGDNPRLVLATADAVFVTSTGSAAVTRIERPDDARPRVRTARGICGAPQGMALRDGVLAVACTDAGVVTLLDASTLAVRAEAGPISKPDAVVALPDAGFAAIEQDGPAVVRLSPEGKVLGRTELGRTPKYADSNVDAVLVGDELVVSQPDSDAVYRIRLADLN